MPRLALLLALPAAAILAAACAQKPPAGAGAEPSRARRDPNVIRRDELSAAQLNEMTVYQVVQQVRPRFLQSLGPTAMGQSGGGLLVYLDATRLGYANAMQDIRMAEIEEVRYLSPSEATLRFGTGHDGGALILKRRR